MSDWPAMRIAWFLRWGLASRKACETRTAAAPPSEVGQHWSFVSGSWISVDFMIWSKVYSSWNWEYGFLALCRWLIRAISAKSSFLAPYLLMEYQHMPCEFVQIRKERTHNSLYSRPALPKS